MNYIYANIDADVIDSGEMKFNKVSAEVDEFSGTPGVTVTLIGEDRDDLHFFFHNLKGDQGIPGPQGPRGPEGPKGDGLGVDGTLPWNKVVGAPSSYTPSAHTHTISEVDGLQGELNAININLGTKADLNQLNYKQDKLHVGSNIIIDEKDVISATTDPDVTSKLNDIDTSINSITVNLASLSSTVSTNQENNNNRFVTNETNISSNSTKITKLINDVNDINSSLVTVSGVVDGLVENKVDKSLVTGSTVRYQVLSDNNYTDDEKTKLSGIQTGAQVNKIESIELNGSTLPISGKVVNLGNLVEQIEGKGLSDENYTQVEKNKLAGVQSAAEVNPKIIVNGVTYTENENQEIDLGVMATADIIEGIENNITEILTAWPTVTAGPEPSPMGAEILESNLKNYTDYKTSNKVDKIEGKTLTSNDFTLAYKNKLEGIDTSAQVNTIENIRVNNEFITPQDITVSGVTYPKTADLGNLVSEVYYNGSTYTVSGKTVNLGNLAVSAEINGETITTDSIGNIELGYLVSYNNLVTSEFTPTCNVTNVIDDNSSSYDIPTVSAVKTKLDELSNRISEIENTLRGL